MKLQETYALCLKSFEADFLSLFLEIKLYLESNVRTKFPRISRLVSSRLVRFENSGFGAVLLQYYPCVACRQTF